jgi:hypothetical protein
MNTARPLFFGLLAAIMSLVIQAAFSLFPFFTFPRNWTETASAGFFFLLIFAFCEELIKISLIWKNSGQLPGNKTRTVIQSALVGVGFAATEIFLHSVSLGNFSDVLTPPYLSLAAVHVTTASMAGYLVSGSGPGEKKSAIGAIIIATFIHFIYNLAVLYF